MRYLPEISGTIKKMLFQDVPILKKPNFYFFYLFLFILDPSQLCPSSHFLPSFFLLPVELPFHFKLNVFWVFFYHSCLSLFFSNSMLTSILKLINLENYNLFTFIRCCFFHNFIPVVICNT